MAHLLFTLFALKTNTIEIYLSCSCNTFTATSDEDHCYFHSKGKAFAILKRGDLSDGSALCLLRSFCSLVMWLVQSSVKFSPFSDGKMTALECIRLFFFATDLSSPKNKSSWTGFKKNEIKYEEIPWE